MARGSNGDVWEEANTRCHHELWAIFLFGLLVATSKARTLFLSIEFFGHSSGHEAV